MEMAMKENKYKYNKYKYYGGPGGVFYSADSDSIFVLEPMWQLAYSAKENKFCGKIYRVEGNNFKTAGMSVLMTKSVVRIGAL